MENNNKYLLKSKYLNIILGIVIIIVIILYYNNSSTKSVVDQSQIASNENIEELEETIVVHIAGEVISPGIVAMKKGDRLYEAIKLVGGPTESADLDGVNLAMILEDQQKIMIPNKDKLSNDEIKDTRININTAQKEILVTLPGIGESIAQSIIDYRETNGGFKNIEEIKNIPRIGDKTFEKIQDSIKAE
ncbi:MAG: helix-hairpin-helix domain-containing protein [Eubacteriaceae bacterium]